MRTFLIATAAIAPTLALAPVAAKAQDTALTAAPAATGNAVADAFLRVLDGGYDNVRAGAARDESGATILTDVTGAGTGTGQTLTIGTVRIEAGSPTATGLTANRVTYDGISEATAEDAADIRSSSIRQMVVTGAALGVEGITNAPGILAGDFDTVRIETAAIAAPDGSFTVASVDLALTGEADTARTLSLDIADWSLATGSFEGGAGLQALGYETLTMDLAARGSWDPAGALEVETVRVAADDAGTLTLNLSAGGVTPETLAGIEAAGGDFATILGLTQGINVDAMEIAYADAGLVDRALDQQAQTMALDRAALVEQSVAAVAAGLASLNNEAFATEVTGAVRTFLDTPGTLTIAARPASSVPLAQVIGGAMMAPQSLPQLLNLTVTAQ